jgi:acyl-CoA thioester hydrolase
VLLLGLRVRKLGNSSVTYEVAVFRESGEVGGSEDGQKRETAAVVGGYTHVFVERTSRRSTRAGMGEELKRGLKAILQVDGTRLSKM